MKKVNLIISIVLILAQLTYAQQRYPTGLVLDDEDYLTIAHSSRNIQVDLGQKSAPRVIDLTSFCPEVRNQGDISSCVGWSVGYAAMTIERSIKHGWVDKQHITENANSALFVFNQLTGGDCQGVRMPKALQLMQEKGNCLARDYDYDVNDCGKSVPTELFDEAKAYRIEEYIRLFEPQDSGSIKMMQVKLVLSQMKPVVVGMKVLNNFFALKDGEQSWFPTVGDRTYAGGHAMVVVGYDDDKFDGKEGNPNMRGAFKLMNSWGKNWGENGFIWVRYAHFGAYCRHAYALMLSGGEPIDFEADMTPDSDPVTIGQGLKALSGSFGFQLYTGQWFNDKPLFREQEVTLKNNHYVLKDRKVGEQFQLFVKSDFDYGYIYVFSVDPLGKPEIHFPKSQAYGNQNVGNNESALIMTGGSLLTIPSRETALTLANKGNDYLVVLFSESKIKPKYIQYLSKELAKGEDLVHQKLPRLIKKHMVPFADITYQRKSMGFEVSTRSKGKIVPIILRVESE